MFLFPRLLVLAGFLLQEHVFPLVTARAVVARDEHDGASSAYTSTTKPSSGTSTTARRRVVRDEHGGASSASRAVVRDEHEHDGASSAYRDGRHAAFTPHGLSYDLPYRTHPYPDYLPEASTGASVVPLVTYVPEATPGARRGWLARMVAYYVGEEDVRVVLPLTFDEVRMMVRGKTLTERQVSIEFSSSPAVRG